MPTVTEVTVAASRKFNHPYEEYSNLGPLVSIKAMVQEGEDPEKVIKDLQAKAESLVEDHKQHMLESLRQLHLMEEYERKVACLESSIKRAQDDLDKLRESGEKLLPEPGEKLPF